MDQNRLFIAIAISVAILIGFQWVMPRPASGADRADERRLRHGVIETGRGAGSAARRFHRADGGRRDHAAARGAAGEDFVR